MKERTVILGLNVGGHDTSAALVIDGDLVAVCEQERYTRDKHSNRFPSEALADCLKIAGLSINDVTEVAVSTDFARLIRETYLKPALYDDRRLACIFDDLERIRGSYVAVQGVRNELAASCKVTVHQHHLCHLASAYYASGFEDTLLTSYDGKGEIESSLIASGSSGVIRILSKANVYPDSLGLLYAAVTHYLGWKYDCDEGIVMGLASYGDATMHVQGVRRTYKEVFREIVQETGDYSYVVNRDYIGYWDARDKWVGNKFIEVFGPKRKPGEPLREHDKHLAAALQERLEEIVLSQLARARKEYGFLRLCLSGGVALNCSLNGKIERSGLFDEIFVQPASGDAGTAIGACYLSYARRVGEFKPKRVHNVYLGAEYDERECIKALEQVGLQYRKCGDTYSYVAQKLADGKIVGWFSGRAEYGPRALGNRSILTRPYPAAMKDYLNEKVKFREPFRPFAPAVLWEYAKEYFNIRQESPHMLIAAEAMPEKRDEIPAVVHVDHTCRVQTVAPSNNHRLRRLLEAFYTLTGCPVLLNTSFNVKGEPIVNSPQDAVKCFVSTNIDILVLEDLICEKDGGKHDER